MKIRVFLIVCFLAPRVFLVAQNKGIKDNTMYFLSSVFVDKKKNASAMDKGHIVFDTKRNAAACFTSCNFIQLKYNLDKSGFRFTSVGPATEPCPEANIELEQSLNNSFSKVTSCTSKGKNLVFMNHKDTLMIFYEKDISKQ